jgi:hypothetical protein
MIIVKGTELYGDLIHFIQKDQILFRNEMILYLQYSLFKPL